MRSKIFKSILFFLIVLFFFSSNIIIFSQDSVLENKLELLSLDIPEFSNELVEKYTIQYTSEAGKKWLESVMENSIEYRGYVQKKLVEHNMPNCLQYLPVIESSYKITALSKSGALGLWQFMKNSVKPFNMTINNWIDERKDPWISTNAAIKKIEENFNYFHDWNLALAAYNCGLGAINRAIVKSGTRDYWQLCKKGYLKQETINYVPKFLAISKILTNKAFYQLNYSEPNMENDKSVNFEELTVDYGIDLALLSKATNINNKELLYYNPALFYSVTPMNTKYKLRLPQNTSELVKEVLDNKKIPMINYIIYSIKSGDSLYALSKHYGIPVEDIQKINNLKSSLIKIGQKLMIPNYTNSGVFKNSKYDQKVVFNGQYTVLPKDTLWSISLKYNVQIEELAKENNLDINNILHVGSVIKVPIIEENN